MYRYDVINKVIELIWARSYLEIWIQQAICFNAVKCENKVGVDPHTEKREWVILKTSDEFFETNTQKFDVVFIDGLHTYEQVKKDFFNSMLCLNKWWVVIFHDMNPSTEERAKSFADGWLWNGDCYKLAIELRNKWFEFSTVEDDQWCLIWKQSAPKWAEHTFELTYETLDKNRQEILNLIPFSWISSLF